MKRNRVLVACATLALLIGGGYAAFRIGQLSATREDMRTLAFVSLWVVEPAVRLSELEAEEPGKLPRSLVVSAEDSIGMVARMSVAFDPNLDNLAMDQKNTLCAIAKNRDRHRTFYSPPKIYDDDLMAHLEKIYRATAKEAVDPATASGRVACSLAGKATQ